MSGTPTPLLPGTLDLLVLAVVSAGPEHGWGIGQRLQEVSRGVFEVNQGSLYPALQRLEARGWIDAEWGVSENNRKARFYELTRAGRKQLVAQTSQWRRLTTAITRVLGPEEA